MMKNKKMGVLAVLVMLVAVTLNAVGGTYAKYISQYGVTDQARVAKWDFRDKSTNQVDLFQSSYTNKNGTYVASSDAWKVIAPGTSGSYSYDVSGSAETNFKVSKKLAVINDVVLKDADENVYYDPIEFSTDGTTWMNADDFNAANPATADVVYAANTYASVKGTIYWRWQFETGHDALDTELGTKAAANPEDYVISAKIEATVEQTEEAATTSHPYVKVSNKLTEAQYAEAVALGYKPDYAVTTFNGKQIFGDVNEYTDDTLKTWYNVAGVENYFYALNMTAPAGYKLINVSAGNKVLIDNTTGSDAKSDVVIINLRSTGSQEFVYKLVDSTGKDVKIETTDADGNVKEIVNQSIDYSGLTFHAKA